MNSVSPRTSKLMQYIIWILFFIPLPSHGAKHHLTESQLNQEFKDFGAFNQLNAQFDQVRSVKAWDSEIKTSGHFSMTKGEKPLIVWEIQQPTYTAIKITDQGIFMKTQADSSSWNPIQSSKVKEQIQNIFAWMSFDTQRIIKDFEVSKPSALEYELIPKNKKTHFNKIKIQINPQRSVQSITMYEDSLDSIRIDFRDTKIQ